MPFDMELADIFYDALKDGYAPYIEDAYRNYKHYIHSLESLDFYLDYNQHMVSQVEKDYLKWASEHELE